MYNLGEHFKVDYEKIKPNKDSIVQGKNYRFTILSERLIRIEYRENGPFLDAPTQLVVNRNFPKPNFNIKQDRNYLEISTNYFKLSYKKEQKINNSKNLKVEVLNSSSVWYYNHV